MVKISTRLDRVIVKARPAEAKGLILSAHHHKHYDIVEGTIIEVGPDVKDYREGEQVLYHRNKSQDIDLPGRRGCEIVREEDICAKISKNTYGSKSK